MTDVHNITLPAAMVEAAARAIYARARRESGDNTVPMWEQLEDYVRDQYRERARAVLAAALAECEVTERWGIAHGGNRPGIDGYLIWGRDEAEVRGWFADPETKPGGRLLRRLVITTPPVVVTPAQEAEK